MSPLTTHFRNYGTLVARILMGGYFLLAGIDKLKDIVGTSAYIESVGLPVPVVLAWLALLIEIVLGAAIIVGKKTSKSALGIAIFVVLATLFFHAPGTWEAVPIQQALFMKNLAILSGLFYMVAYGPGEGWHLSARGASSVVAHTHEHGHDHNHDHHTAV